MFLEFIPASSEMCGGGVRIMYVAHETKLGGQVWNTLD